MNKEPTVRVWSYLGLFLVALTTLMFEILLTRIFSVTMYYHFAFMAISVAMFGMTVGALRVYLFPKRFAPGRAHDHLTRNAVFFAVSVVISFIIHAQFPVDTHLLSFSAHHIGLLVMTYVVIAVPFVFSGVCVCLALTKFPRQVSRLYAADLAGAGLGCILIIRVLKLTDGPTAVIVVACLGGAAALAFAVEARRRRLKHLSIASCLLIVASLIVHSVLARSGSGLLPKLTIKGAEEVTPVYEKWNSFSRITVHGDPNQPTSPFGWGLSATCPPNFGVRQLLLTIDTAAGTVLTFYDGDLSKVSHLRYDITNLVHAVRPDSNVLVIGAGGGRDVLSALLFGQKSVLAVEYNQDIIDTVNGRFGAFTGHLDRDPRVEFVNDEARSYVARMDRNFDIIQVSLIDTWAATAAGAFALTENSLYTVEAWDTFLRHLSNRGVLTFSRYYFQGRPGEIYRLTSLAATALTRLGVANPRQHIVIARVMGRTIWGDECDGVGTILVSKAPFTADDLAKINQAAAEMKFDVMLAPDRTLDDQLARIASGRDLETLTASFPLNIAPPTDDRPFFFHMLRLRDVFNRELWKQGIMTHNMRAVNVLGTLLIVVVGLTVLCIVVPLALTTDRSTLRGALPLCTFFAGIGFGFMFIEISQMQRLIIFLGHPTYSLSVVLFSLLLSSGCGSYVTQTLDDAGLRRSATVLLLVLIAVLTVFGALTPYAIGAFETSTTAVRIAVATGILLPLGLFMGMAFPIGMKTASGRSDLLTPWLWGINGATSVCASVLAVVIALTAGISVAFWVGVACYVVALAAFLAASRVRAHVHG